MQIGKMSSEEMFAAKMEAELINKKINHGKEGKKGTADKDMFMKLLVTQLKYQDPTRPMEDREFIAQMAQFSSLEQMTNMNKEMTNLLKSSRSSEAFSLLGRHVDTLNPETNRRVSGVVTSIQYNGDEQVLMVGNEQVRISDISTVRNAEAAVPGAANAAAGAIKMNTINNALQNALINQMNGKEAVQEK
jgi:flagellar basal-body rod modification protein FlgD